MKVGGVLQKGCPGIKPARLARWIYSTFTTAYYQTQGGFGPEFHRGLTYTEMMAMPNVLVQGLRFCESLVPMVIANANEAAKEAESG